MTREELLAQAKKKYEREQLIEQAKAKASQQSNETYDNQNMPEALSLKDRWIAKNFANSPEAQAAYIKKQYPLHDVTTKDGEVFMRKDSSVPWQAIDPNTGFFSKDFINDVGDIGYDATAGAIQGAGTALGGLIGGMASLPAGGVGALPAAAATSAVLGGGLETARQGIGKWAGIPQEMDFGKIGTSTAIGAVTPLLFGAGNITKGISSKILDGVDKQILINQQRGLLGRGMDAIAPMFSSVPKDAIDAYSKHGQQGIDNIINNGGMINYLDEQASNATNAIQNNKSNIGRQFNDAYKNAISEVPLDNVKKSFVDTINKMEQSKASNPTAWTDALEARLNSLKEGYNKYLPEANTVDAERAFDLQQTLKKLNNNFDLKKDPNNFDFLSSVDGAYSNLNKGLDEATAGVSSQLKGQYKDAIALQELAGNNFNDGQKLYNTLSNMDKATKLQFKEQVVPRVKDLGVDMQPAYENVQSFKYFADPKALPISNGSTSTSYTNTLGNLGSDIGALAGNAINPSYTATKAGGAVGGLIGAIGASPKMTKFIIDYNKKQTLPFFINQNEATQPLLEYMFNDKYNNK